MNCKIGHLAYTVPLYHIYETLDDIFRISKIHSRQLIIFWFWRFLQKKIKSSKSAEKILQDKYRRLTTLDTLKQSFVYLIRRPRYSRKRNFPKILQKKKEKKLWPWKSQNRH